MAKRLLLIAVGALALTACTSEDVLDDVAASRNAIKFENVVNKPSRAAVDLETDNLQQFNVFGFFTMPEAENNAHEVFNDVPVKKGKGGMWTYDESLTRYWVTGAKYYFYAYSCGSVSKLNTEQYGKFFLDMDSKDKEATKRVLEIDNYVSDCNHQHDLIFASNTGINYSNTNEAVEFSFNHILSKVQARFTSQFQEEYDVVISDVSFQNICNMGDYDFAQDWKNVSRKGETPSVYLLNTNGVGNAAKMFDKDGNELTDEEGNVVRNKDAAISVKNVKVDGKQSSVLTNYAYVIPVGDSETTDYGDEEAKLVTLKFTVNVMYNGDKVMSDILTVKFQPDWKSGKYYIYNVVIDPDALKMGKITFSVKEVNGWGTALENNLLLHE